VLIIEDSATLRGFLRRVFENLDPAWSVIEAAEGRAALNEMTRNKADLIVTDLQMPGMDGRAFIAKIRSNSLLKRKSVLVLSGEEMGDLRSLYAADPGIRFLSKPSNAAQIGATALELLAATLTPAT
jgi:CheY-like chemotaxis protein